MHNMELAGRRILVTGGASGMGAGIVRALPKLGARLVSTDRDKANGQRIADEAGADLFIAMDVSDAESVGSAFDAAAKTMGGIDVVIHAAGIAPSAPAKDIPLEMWSMVMAVNATGTYLVNQAAFHHMQTAGGSIINFASAAGIEGYPGKSAYAAAKGAVVAWTRSVAREWGAHAIRVNALAPAIWTAMYDKTRAEMTPEQLAAHDNALKSAIPLGGKLGEIEGNLVPVVAFLASEGSHFITGQVLAVDGGSLMVR